MTLEPYIALNVVALLAFLKVKQTMKTQLRNTFDRRLKIADFIIQLNSFFALAPMQEQEIPEPALPEALLQRLDENERVGNNLTHLKGRATTAAKHKKQTTNAIGLRHKRRMKSKA